MATTGWRVRAILADRFWLVVVGLLVLTVLGGVGTFQSYAEPGTHVEQRPGPEARYVGEFAHEATVVKDNPVFRTGTTLSDRSAYFSGLTPVLNGTFEYRYAASDAGTLSVTETVSLVARSVSRDAEESVEFWRISRPLGGNQADAVEPGESVSVTFATNVTALANETRRIDRAMGDTPGEIHVRVVATVHAEGAVNGRSVDRRQRYVLGIDPSYRGVYRVEDPGAVTNATSQRTSVTVENTPGPLGSIGGPLAVVFGAAGLVFLGQARYRNALALDETERNYLADERDRAEFEEWITTARLPPRLVDGTTVDVDSLAGLVDVAIDNGRRVLRDGASRTYVVLDDDCVFRYEATRPPREGPWVSVVPPIRKPSVSVPDPPIGGRTASSTPSQRTADEGVAGPDAAPAEDEADRDGGADASTDAASDDDTKAGDDGAEDGGGATAPDGDGAEDSGGTSAADDDDVAADDSGGSTVADGDED